VKLTDITATHQENDMISLDFLYDTGSFVAMFKIGEKAQETAADLNAIINEIESTHSQPSPEALLQESGFSLYYGDNDNISVLNGSGEVCFDADLSDVNDEIQLTAVVRAFLSGMDIR